VEGYCTCGAKLPADALFCHRCGKPQRDDIPEPEPQPEPFSREEPAAEPTELAAVATAPLAEINFHNGAAVRVGFLAAALVQLLTTLSAAVGASLFLPLILFAGGFYAVILYRRRTGAGLTPANGVRIGWMTGVFAFVIMTVFFTLGIAMLAGSDQLMKAYQDSASNLGLPPDAAKQIEKLMQDPAAFGLSLLFGLAIQFLILTLVCALGGLVGAKFRPASPPPPPGR
jgi:hypothetical protein